MFCTSAEAPVRSVLRVAEDLKSVGLIPSVDLSHNFRS